MNEQMTHRRPDDSGIYVDPTASVGLGHRRLSIVDLSAAGHGPMHNEDQTVWITYNGEVYNHQALRRELEIAGHRFRSRTDTEALIHMYEERGPELVHRLRGIFAFALWDSRRRRLVLARDHVGVKPLYYAEAGGHLVWASEIKALLTHPAVTPELNEDALLQYLTFAAVPAPETLFSGIHKLAPGHRLVVEGDARPRVERWWTPAGHALPPELNPLDEATVAQYLMELLTSAITEQTMADVPHGVLLSGGVDSSLLVAVLSRALSDPVRTFSVGFENAEGFDERAYARKVAQRFATEHQELVLQPKQVIELLPELVYAQDEPLGDWVCLPLQLLSRLVRSSGVTVVQVGEGSDELFAGYPRYRRYARLHAGLWGTYMRLPRPVRQAVGVVTGKSLENASRLREPRDLFWRAARNEPLFLSGAVAWWEMEKHQLLTPRLSSRLGNGAGSAALVSRNLARFEAEAPQGDVASAMAYQDLMVRLPELLLMRVDKMTMLSSVEARVPFLDHRIVALALALPMRFKLRGGETKHILKRAARNLLPEDVVRRPKRGFDVPLAAWLRERPLGPWAEDTIMGSSLLGRDVFQRDEVARVIRAHRSGRADYGFPLWTLINLCAWHDHWVAGTRR
jgi:asparagine synthase (glutamine-hydrolysing)